ncbi:thioredoxin reductase [Tamaricihabitans halophyticus]|uniref:Thioredoxin reductase n=2 Tax=Tamaricihabitans halophyticus TaxID=1262583 RepID=A0A4R2QSD9_9PSEU|nr:NAD(P)/FAD-dependent oxidoreductase [Tamaricihabitans halophyticus]TCP49961.1 thioredoxin reductase [Tamaricihabitans halophyticus]
MTEMLDNRYDVVVIGGGAAGLNGALMLARARRSVLVLDSGTPRNAPADGVHGLLGVEGTPPRVLLERGQSEVRQYGGRVVNTVVDAVRRGADGVFEVPLADGRVVGARRLLVTSGVIDELPDIPGLRERWGRDVVHCPYCHGWEVRDLAIGVLANGPLAVHQALLFRQWSQNIVFFARGAVLTDEQAEQFAARGIDVVSDEVAAVEVIDDRLAGVRLADGTVVERAVLAVGSRTVARADFLTGLGLRAEEHPSGVGDYIRTDEAGRTDVPGVWAAGNLTNPVAQVGAAAVAGAVAAAQINLDLLHEDTQIAVTGYRARLAVQR